MIQLNFGRDVQGFNAYAPAFSDIDYKTILSTGVAQSFTVPSSATNWIAVFSFEPGTRIWVSNDGNAATLPSSSFAAGNSELNPAARSVLGGSQLSFITNDTTSEIGISLYAVNQF